MSESGLVGPGGAPLNVDGAKAILGDDQLRAKQAASEIKMILEAYDAQLFPVMMLSPKGVIGVSVDVIPNTRPSIPMAPETTGDPTLQENVNGPKVAGPNADPVNAKNEVDPTPAEGLQAEKEANQKMADDDHDDAQAEVIPLHKEEGNVSDEVEVCLSEETEALAESLTDNIAPDEGA